ncbi:hypothetical protein ABEB36_014352 [Hypothenemus hampei]|uniref:Uncharacterized protein n=1 Tax=Hypothenemus hampei TaxID=57062 RepID=A0ABD1E481_HYPHA
MFKKRKCCIVHNNVVGDIRSNYVFTRTTTFSRWCKTPKLIFRTILFSNTILHIYHRRVEMQNGLSFKNSFLGKKRKMRNMALRPFCIPTLELVCSQIGVLTVIFQTHIKQAIFSQISNSES